MSTNPVYAGHHFHHVARISAHTNGAGVLTVTLHGHDGHNLNEAEVKVFLNDEALVERLIKAINSAAEVVDSASTELHVVDEAYKRFPDDIEASEHPLGKITVDRGPLRFAFLAGAKFERIKAGGEPKKEPV